MSVTRKMKRKSETFLQKVKRSETKVYKLRQCYNKSERLVNKAKNAVIKLQEKINRYFVALGNIFTIYVLRKKMRMSCKDTVAFIEAYSSKAECLVRKLVTYDEIEKYEVMATEAEYNPLKWTDYEYPFHSVSGILRVQPSASGEEAVYNNLFRAMIIREAEGVFYAHEMLTLSALNDHCGYKKIRCKRVIESVRELEYSAPDDVLKLIKWIGETGLYLGSAVDELIKGINLWKLGLKEQCIKAVPCGREFLKSDRKISFESSNGKLKLSQDVSPSMKTAPL